MRITEHRDLRIGPASLQRLHPDDEARRRARARVHGRSRRGRAAASRTSQVGDRVVVPFPIACGHCAQCEREMYSLCENSNPNAWMAEKLWGYSPCGIFGYSHMLGGYAGGQAEYARVPFADVGPLKVPDEPRRRTGAVPLRHLPDRLHGGRGVRHPAGRHDRGLGLRPGRAVRDQERVPARRRARHRDRSLPVPAAHRRASGPAPRRSTTRRSDVYEALEEMTGGRGPDSCIDAVGMEGHAPGLHGRLRPGQDRDDDGDRSSGRAARRRSSPAAAAARSRSPASTAGSSTSSRWARS